MNKELTEQQKQFCYWYIEEKPMTEIANKLDVHRNTLTNWLKNTEVKNFITEIRSQDAVMTLQDKRNKLMEIINGDSYDEVVNPKTGKIVQLRSRTQDRINALKLLMQVDGDLQDNKTITVNFNTNGIEAPKEALLIEDGNIIELDPKDFTFIDEDEEEGNEED